MTVQMARLGDICEINPRLPRDHGLGEDSEVSFVPMAAVSEVSGTIESATLRRFAEVKKGYTAFSDGDVLFAKITPCMENGKAALASGLFSGRGFGSTEFHVLRVRESVLPEWIYYFVRREPFRRDAKRNFTGTAGQQRVPTSFLQETLIPVPPLDEQRHIVDLLARAEGIVRLRREAQRKAAELIPAIFVEIFGDPGTNPKGWPVYALGTLSDVQGGVQVSAARRTLPLTKPYLRVANVFRDRLDLTEVKSIQLTEGEFERTRLQRGDLLIVEGHGNPEEVGRVAVWNGEVDECTHQNHLIRARPALSRLLPHYASALLNSPGGRQSLRRAGKTTSGLSTISAKNVKETPVILPPVDLQTTFVRYVDEVSSIMRRQSLARIQAESALRALLARAFGG